MKEISRDKIIDTIKTLAIEAATDLSPDMKEALKESYEKETSPLGKDILGQIITNYEIAAEEHVPMCQDTGITVVFVELGTEVHLDYDLEDAINAGVRKGYDEGFLRKSVCHPLTRINTGDNTPAIVHVKSVPGDKIKFTLAPKGAGSENMSQLKMLKPSDGLDGIKDFILKCVKEGGGNPCPPIVVGVGIGGTFEWSAIMAKRAVLRKIGESNPDPEVAKLEKEILETVNKTGVGPMGFGGDITSVGVHIETRECHIASLPVAVNIQCHAGRHKEAIL